MPSRVAPDPTGADPPGGLELTAEQRRLLDDVARTAEERRRRPDFPAAALAAIEAAAADRRSRPGRLIDLRRAVGQVEVHVGIDLDVPTSSRLPLGGLLKAAVKRLVGWYLRFVGYQVSALGHAVVNLGNTVAERVERLDTDLVTTREKLEELEQRLVHLEGQVGVDRTPRR
jgi:hypothetical protein